LAAVEIAGAAIEDLDRLTAVLSLPADTRDRVRASLAPLAEFPLLGPELAGRWQGLRFLLGPWRWMLIVYEYLEAEDRVVILTIQDARSSSAATSG
jgi:plasmid stabilization system protein ParE